MREMAWRDFLRVHPAAELFHMMGQAELKELGEDIKANGLLQPIVLWRDGPDGEYLLLDGRNRLDAMELVGLPVAHNIESMLAEMGVTTEEPPIDPYEYVISANIRRRHLTRKQRRELVAKVLKQRPELSDNAVGGIANVDHKTVAPIRRDLERGGEIPHHRSRVGKDGVKQPSSKPARKPESPASGTKGKTRPPQIETSNEEIQPSLPFELPQAPSPVPKPLPSPKAKVAIQPDPVAVHRAAIRGAVIGVGKIADVDFDQVATSMSIGQLRAARSELDLASQIMANWRDALDAALDRATIGEVAPELSAEETIAALREHDGVR
jgi:hypothetical protein